MISLKLSATRTAKMTHWAMSKCTINLNLQAFLRYSAPALMPALRAACNDNIRGMAAMIALTMRLESPAA